MYDNMRNTYYEWEDPDPTEWGKWECPICGEEWEDPDFITETTCGKCNAIVALSDVDDNGNRIARLKNRDAALRVNHEQ